MNILFVGKKRFQEVKNEKNSCHIYSNALKLRVCPILSSSKYLFSNRGMLSNISIIFPVNPQYYRFVRILMQ